MKKARYNIKETIYLNLELSNAISEICERNEMGFNATIRYLLNNALQDSILNNPVTFIAKRRKLKRMDELNFCL